jgi:hypothetical protein
VVESRAAGFEDDGWYAPVIKLHSLDKIALHNA